MFSTGLDLRRLLERPSGQRRSPEASIRQQALRPARHLQLARRPQRIYAIGDVHGRLDLLRRLEAQIIEDASNEPCLVVMLGDYIDRGQDSAGVIEHLVVPPPRGWTRICLSGNHEAMMINAFGDAAMADLWLANGGDTTLASYGIDPGRPRGGWRFPAHHLAFLGQLSVSLSMPGFCFVHAGRARGRPASQQHDHDLLWCRRDQGDFVPRPDDADTIVHGHTPTADPVVSPGRIGIDTGAVFTGRLTALAIDSEARIRFLRS